MLPLGRLTRAAQLDAFSKFRFTEDTKSFHSILKKNIFAYHLLFFLTFVIHAILPYTSSAMISTCKDSPKTQQLTPPELPQEKQPHTGSWKNESLFSGFSEQDLQFWKSRSQDYQFSHAIN